MKAKYLWIAIICFVLVIALVIAFTANAKAATPDQVRNYILDNIKLSKTGFSGIQTPGTILIAQQECLRADQSLIAIRPTTIKDGAVISIGGGQVLSNSSGQLVEIGDQLYCAQVSAGSKGVEMLLDTVKTYPAIDRGQRIMSHYRCLIRFQYDNFSSVDPATVLSDIYKFIKPKDLVNSEKNNPKTVSLGMNEQEVIQILGPPKQRFDLSSKITLVYDGIKVILIDGKVADVQ